MAYKQWAVATIWYGDDDDFLHRRNGRFHHRKHPAHIEHCVNIIKQRNAAGEEIRIDD